MKKLIRNKKIHMIVQKIENQKKNKKIIKANVNLNFILPIKSKKNLIKIVKIVVIQ